MAPLIQKFYYAESFETETVTIIDVKSLMDLQIAKNEYKKCNFVQTY